MGTLIYREVVPLPHEAPPEPEHKGNLARIAEKIVDKISGGVETVIGMIHEATAKPDEKVHKKNKKKRKWEPPHIMHPLPPVVNYVALYKEKPPKRKRRPQLERQYHEEELAAPNVVGLRKERMHLTEHERSPLK